MRILDRYLLRQYIRTFVICFLSLTGLYIVIDAFGHLSQFLSYAENHGSLFSVMVEYYGYRSLDVFNQLSGILAFISAVFTITWIQRHNEMTAMSAAGIPTRRIVSPILIAALVIGFVAATNRELVIPRLRDELARDSRDLSGTKERPVRPRFDNHTDILIFGKHLTLGDRRIEQPQFRLPRVINAYGSKIAAAEAHYWPADGERPSGYLLRGITLPRNLAERESIFSKDGEPVILTPRDTPWLEADECFVCSHLTFEMLAGGDAWRSYSSTPELIRGLHNPSTDYGANVRVAVHGRFVQPFLDATLVLLGLPLVLTRGTRNIFLAIGQCLAVVVVFMLTTIACQNLGAMSLVRPALAAWLPLFIFVPVAAWLSVTWRR